MPIHRKACSGFPAGFTWGAATASYQIEGAAREDGKGLSVWDEFCRRPGAVWRDQNADVACDHYNRYREDVALMKRMGLKAYRMSVAWPRVIPCGTGRVNPKGLDFYDRLVDELLKAGIAPFLTLFHWDYPLALQRRGGWLSPDSPGWFADYAGLVVAKLSDRVGDWMTLNEPACFIDLGYRQGTHAPGLKLGLPEVLRAAHHALLGHGRAVQAIRAAARTPARVGLAQVGFIRIPATRSAADVRAARRAMFAVTEPTLWNNGWWMEPICRGRYPEDGARLFGAAMPEIGPDDMRIISQPLDYFGVNIYGGLPVRAGRRGVPELVPFSVGHPVNALNWEILPESLYWGPKFLWERYRKSIVITENGVGLCDWISLDGKVHDPQRIDYLARYLRQFRRAIAEGVRARGYFVWTVTDNFEWAEGFKIRVGLIYTEYATQRRIPKDSAAWYRRVIATNGRLL